MQGRKRRRIIRSGRSAGKEEENNKEWEECREGRGGVQGRKRRRIIRSGRSAGKEEEENNEWEEYREGGGE